MDAKQLTAWVTAVGAALALLGGSVKGAYEFGVDQMWWGRRVGTLERVNMALAPRYLMQQPVTSAEFLAGPGQQIKLKAFADGVVAVYQIVRDEKAVGGYRQALVFLTPQPWEEVLASGLDVGSALQFGPAVAWAQASVPPIFGPYQDAILERRSDGWALVQRVYTNGCIDRFWVYLGTGQIDWASYQRWCS